MHLFLPPDRYSPDDTVTSSAGSPAFQPPELANGNPSFSGFKLDIWSAGITLWNFATGTYPFEGETIFSLYAAIGRGVYTIPHDVDEVLADLLTNILCIDVAKRYTISQIKEHE